MCNVTMTDHTRNLGVDQLYLVRPGQNAAPSIRATSDFDFSSLHVSNMICMLRPTGLIVGYDTYVRQCVISTLRYILIRLQRCNDGIATKKRSDRARIFRCIRDRNQTFENDDIRRVSCLHYKKYDHVSPRFHLFLFVLSSLRL